jgi:hypothetical protein
VPTANSRAGKTYAPEHAPWVAARTVQEISTSSSSAQTPHKNARQRNIAKTTGSRPHWLANCALWRWTEKDIKLVRNYKETNYRKGRGRKKNLNRRTVPVR